MKLIAVTILFLMTGCGADDQGMTAGLPIEPGELIFNKGDCILFRADSLNLITAVIINISKDEGGIWYGLCNTDLDTAKVPTLQQIKSCRLSGRKIESSDTKGYVIGVDLVYMNDSCIRQLSEKINLLSSFILKPGIFEGSMSPTTNLQNFNEQVKEARQKRKLPPDDYRNHFNPKNRPQEYIPITEFVRL